MELRKAPGCSTELYFTVRPRTGLDSGRPHSPWNILETTNAPLQQTSFSKDESSWSSITSYLKSGFLAQIRWILLSVSLDWTVDCFSKQNQSLCCSVCFARSAVAGKSVESFTAVSPSRTESALASVARISPQVQRRSASVYNKTTIRNPNWTQVWFLF